MFPGIFFQKPIAQYGNLWRVLLFAFLWIMALLSGPSHGEEPPPDSAFKLSAASAHGIAMHGEPKYKNGLDHFDYVNPAAPKGGVLHLSALGSFDSLNPFIIKGAPPRPEQFNVYVFESLMYRAADEPFTIYPWLAERAEMAPDRSAITYTLNPKARWHDGKPVTTADLLFTMEILRTAGRPAHRAYYSKVKSARVVGPHSVRYEFKAALDGSYDRELPLIIGLMPILPQHFWADKDFTASGLHPPLGSGPYRVSAVQAGRRIVLERVPDYWGNDLPVMRGQHNFTKIQIDYYRDEGIAREAFLAGRVDLRFETDPLKLQTAYRSAAVARGDIVLQAVPHKRPEPLRGVIFNTRRPLFTDKILRQALRDAGDFAFINQTLYGGAYKRSYSSFPNSALAAPASEQSLIVSKAARRAALRRAQQNLLQAGYLYQDGQLQTPAGQPVSFEILLQEPQDERIVLAWRESLRPLGVEINIRTVDSAQFQARLNSFDYDAVVFRWINSLSPGNEQLVYWGSVAADTQGSRNYAGVKDRAIDQLANQLLGIETYPQLQQIAQQLDRTLIDGAYVVPFFYLGADLVARWRHIQCPTTVPLTGFELRACWHQP